jgi:hypothetical protein
MVLGERVAETLLRGVQSAEGVAELLGDDLTLDH